MKINLIKSVILLSFLTAITGCSKEHVEPKQVIQDYQKERVDSLTKFMAKQTGVNATDINYDNKTQMFSMFGHEQISLDKLTELFNVSKRK